MSNRKDAEDLLNSFGSSLMEDTTKIQTQREMEPIQKSKPVESNTLDYYNESHPKKALSGIDVNKIREENRAMSKYDDEQFDMQEEPANDYSNTARSEKFYEDLDALNGLENDADARVYSHQVPYSTDRINKRVNAMGKTMGINTIQPHEVRDPSPSIPSDKPEQNYDRYQTSTITNTQKQNIRNVFMSDTAQIAQQNTTKIGRINFVDGTKEDEAQSARLVLEFDETTQGVKNSEAMRQMSANGKYEIADDTHQPQNTRQNSRQQLEEQKRDAERRREIAEENMRRENQRQVVAENRRRNTNMNPVIKGRTGSFDAVGAINGENPANMQQNAQRLQESPALINSKRRHNAPPKEEELYDENGINYKPPKPSNKKVARRKTVEQQQKEQNSKRIGGVIIAILFVLTVVLTISLFSTRSAKRSLEEQVKTLEAEQKDAAELQLQIDTLQEQLDAASTTETDTTSTEDATTPTTEEDEATTTDENTTTSSDKTYKVVSGDTLSSISSKMYGDTTHTKEIMDANNLTGANLKIGQELKIPAATSTSTSTSTTTTTDTENVPN